MTKEKACLVVSSSFLCSQFNIQIHPVSLFSFRELISKKKAPKWITLNSLFTNTSKLASLLMMDKQSLNNNSEYI